MDVSGDPILFSIDSSLNLQGEKLTQRLSASSDTVKVDAKSWLMQDISDVRTAAGVGSGVLQIRLRGLWLDVMRFSNERKHDFDHAVRILNRIRTRQSLRLSDEDLVDPRRCPRCSLMLEFAGETCPRCLQHRAALRRMVHMIRPYWKEATLLLSLLLFGLFLDMTWPLLTRFLVDYVLAKPRPPASGFFSAVSKASSHDLLRWVVAALAGVHLIRALINVFTLRLSSLVGNQMTFDVRTELVEKLESLGLGFYGKQETGSLVGRVVYDSEAIQSFMTQITSGFFMQLCLVALSFCMMFALEPTLALWTLVPAPFVFAGAVVYWRYVHPRYQRFWERTSRQAGLLNGLLTGIRVVKSFGREDHELDRFQKASRDVKITKNSLDKTAALFNPTMAIVFQIGGWIVWYVGGERVLSTNISLGTLMAFFGFLSMFYGPLGNLTNLTSWLTQFSTQLHRLIEILDAPTLESIETDLIPVTKARGRIEFRDVGFSYVRGTSVFRSLNLTIEAGQCVGLVGRSGSGKTSLVNLLYRFFEIDEGEIKIDGVTLKNISTADLRKQITIVLQDAFLFAGTLLENISYGQPNAALEDVLAVSQAANCHGFILNHKLGYETTVGERGQELSGGERQRISIARALLKEAPILILDEATSAVDSESENSVQAAVRDLLGKKTILIIAHRLSTLRFCDRIFLIEDGAVAESGSHPELMDQNGLYARWVRMQNGDHEDASPVARPPLSVKWLDPNEFKILRTSDGDLQVHLGADQTFRAVSGRYCFPISQPNFYISLRGTREQSDREEEIGILKNFTSLPLSAQSLVKDSLNRTYLVRKVETIQSIRKFGQFLAFKIQSNFGKEEFVIRYSPEGVLHYGPNGRMILDLEENMYLIEDLHRLSLSQLNLFQRYIYW